MTLDSFLASVRDPAPPAGLSPALLALWHEARGDWENAHTVAQGVGSPDGAWVHAYLHRKEGDAGNARYWYGRAGQPFPTSSLDEERVAIARTLLAGKSGA